MADYQATANAIYDPQISAESRLAQNSLATTQGDIAASKAELQPYYQRAFSQLQNGEDTAHAKQIMTDNENGVLNGGLHANQDMAITHQYAGDRSALATEQGNKIAAYDRASGNANNSYQATLASILDKYNGQKAAFVQDSLSKDNDRAFQQKLAEQSAALQRELSASSNANAYKIAAMQSASYAPKAAEPTAQDKIMQAIQTGLQGYGSKGVMANGNNAAAPGYTEKTLAPQIKAMALQYGISPDDAINMMYNYRKGQFGN